MQIRNLKAVCVLLIVLGSVITAKGQNITLKGVVIDAESNQPVEFANLGIVGSYMGTASDFNGQFELIASNDFENSVLRISAVGYKPKEIIVKELVQNTPSTIKLFPQSYGIGQVEIMAESKQLYGILKTSANMIGDNYSGSYSAKVYYSQTIDKNKKSEFALSFNDESGYKDRSYSNAFEKRNYKVDESRHNYEITPLMGGIIRAEDILEFDIARTRGNILDASVIDNFNLELLEKSKFSNDSVWVISYSLDKPDFSTSGDELITDYKGVVYISMENHAILRNEIQAVSNNYQLLGRSSKLKSETDNSYSYSVYTNYRKNEDGKYLVSKIVYKGKDKNDKSINMEWIAYDYLQMQPGFESREYYSSKETDKKFWDRFTIPKE